MRALAARKRFLAEILDGTAHDRWQDQRVPLEGAALADGTFVEVEVRDGAARPIAAPLAEPGSALADLVRIAVRFDIDPVFPPAVHEEVERTLSAPGLDDPGLVDSSDVPFVTIDNEDSRDLDQALAIVRDGDGYRVLYALADASWFVRPGTALFGEALRRSASYYLPGWMVPMLPRPLSEGLVSLNADVPRRALVFDMRLDRAGVCVETRFYRARIRSRGKLTYDGVQAYLDSPDEHEFAWREFAPSLRLLREVGELRIADATARDVVHHRRQSIEVGRTDRRSFVIYGGLRNDVERYNEQISLLCNMEGANRIRTADEEAFVQAIFRVHPAPPPERVRRFEGVIDEIVRERGEAWRWDRKAESLATYLRGLPWEGEDKRLSRAIQRQAIMMNVRSTFSDEASAHHGVGAEVYARFSSPMREIVGIFLHKELLEHLDGAGDIDDELREQVIEAANRAKDLQRKLTAVSNRIALDQLFEADLAGAEPVVRRGTVMGVTAAKIHVLLDEPPVDVKVYRRHLGGAPKPRIGEAIDLRVTGRDQKHDRWILRPSDRGQAPGP